MSLKLSKTNKIIGGVCGGIAEYTGIDVTLLRILWVIMVLFAGVGIGLYILLWLLLAILGQDSTVTPTPPPVQAPTQAPATPAPPATPEQK